MIDSNQTLRRLSLSLGLVLGIGGGAGIALTGCSEKNPSPYHSGPQGTGGQTEPFDASLKGEVSVGQEAGSVHEPYQKNPPGQAGGVQRIAPPRIPNPRLSPAETGGTAAGRTWEGDAVEAPGESPGDAQ